MMKYCMAFFCLLSLSGCGTQSYYDDPIITDGSDPVLDERSEDMAVRQQLLQHYQAWQGVPYRLGRTDKSGVDCSSFTQQAFQQQFGITLPRTTADQAFVGIQVANRSLQPGDLLFYRSRFKVRHVGIYVGRGEFLHASTSRGVMISRVDNPYWRKYFWQARRLDY